MTFSSITYFSGLRTMDIFQFFTPRRAWGLTGLGMTPNVFDFLLQFFAAETESLVKTASPYPFCQSRFFQGTG
jgi:hypothetical protein